MTEKLYNQDSYLREFTATVTACEPHKDGFRIALDQTAFFPEGGGQCGDQGLLNSTEVFDTHEQNGIVWHYTREPLTVESAVKGCLNWEKRFSNMQQHSAEHIVSGLVHARFGYDNVGFHLGEAKTTLDFNGPITQEELQDLENAANQVIWENIPVQVSYPSREELAVLDYRSKIEIAGQVRIVTFPGVDICACCAPHVKNTGAIGLLKLTDVQSHRGGVRIELLAGDRALRDYQKKESIVHNASAALSAKEEQILEALKRVQTENYRLNGQLMELQRLQISAKVSALPAGSKDPIFFEASLDAGSMREFVNLLTQRCEGIACVFSGTESEGYRYVLGSRTCDVRPLCKALNHTFQGKGGGKPEMVQGSLTGSEAAIREQIQNF